MAKKLVIPWELKYKFTWGGWSSLFKGFLYAIREECGAATALKCYERVAKMDDRIKNMTNTIKEVFKLEGNDAETITKWWDIYWEIVGIEGTWLERSETIARCKITKCPFKTEPKDISEWCLTIFSNLVVKTINPKTTSERPKSMCAGDSYCDYIYKIEE